MIARARLCSDRSVPQEQLWPVWAL